MAKLQISKVKNYIHILDMDANVLYQEHSFRVLVRKITSNGSTYDITFLRPDSTPAAFYSASIGQLYDDSGVLWTQILWEKWYVQNTGDIQTTVATITPVIAQPITPFITNEAGTVGFIGTAVSSISFASNGTVAALVTFDNGGSFVSLAPGVSVKMDVASLDRYYNASTFGWDTTALGSSLLITYNLF